jgi:tetratricopeptide (TPR) repeat protein
MVANSLRVSTALEHPPHFFRQAARRVAERSLVQIQQGDEQLAAAIYTQALHILPYALQMTDHWPLARDLLLLLTDKLEQRGEWASLLPYLEHGLRLSQQHHDHYATAEIHLRMGYLFQMKGQLTAAEQAYVASSTGFAEIGHPERYARALNRCAFTAWQQHRLAQALVLVNQARTVVGTTHPEQGNALMVQGWILFTQRNWRESHNAFAQAVVILQQSGSRYQLACALRDLAAPLQMLTRYTEAAAHYQQALALFEQLGNRFQQAVIQMNLGVIALTSQQPTAALELFMRAEPIFRHLHDYEHLGKLYLNQALAHRTLGEFATSVRLLQASIELLAQLGNPDWWADSVDELGVTYLHLGEPHQAIATFHTALAILGDTDPAFADQRAEIAEHLQAALGDNAACCAPTVVAESTKL